MTAAVRAIKRHDTESEWIITSEMQWSSPCDGACPSGAWTILSEAQVDISYKAALTATPQTTAPCSPLDDDLLSSTTPVRRRLQIFKPAPVTIKKAVGPAGVPASDSDECNSLYNMRKGRVAGGSTGKSRQNRKK